jgi:hypothetical protein
MVILKPPFSNIRSVGPPRCAGPFDRARPELVEGLTAGHFDWLRAGWTKPG